MVGNETRENVTASIATATVEAAILVGQSFLSKSKSWSVDNEAAHSSPSIWAMRVGDKFSEARSTLASVPE